MQTKFGIGVKRDGGKVATCCGSCPGGCVIQKPTSVANVETCELGEHCRCKSFDTAYKADCWNWIGKVTL